MSFGYVSERSNLELLRCSAYALVTRAISPAQIAQWSPSSLDEVMGPDAMILVF